MFKKWLVTGSAIAVGTAMLITSAFAQSSSGYDVLKEALKNKKAHENFTGELTMKVEDNKKVIFDGKGTIKADHASKAMSVIFNIKGNEGEAEIKAYCSDGKLAIKTSDSDVYKVMDHKDKMGIDCKKHGDAESSKLKETLADALFGDLKDYINVENSNNGDKTVTLNLKGSEIPAHLNALASLGIKHAGSSKHNEATECPILGDKQIFKHPKLATDIVIKEVNHKAVIDKDNNIKAMAAELKVEGKDSNGELHDLELSLNADFTNIGNTVPDKIDLEGQKTETIKYQKH